MTYFVLLSLITVTGVLLLPIISLQSSVTVETRLASVYNKHIPRRTHRRSTQNAQSWNVALEGLFLFLLIRDARSRVLNILPCLSLWYLLPLYGSLVCPVYFRARQLSFCCSFIRQFSFRFRAMD